MGRIIREKNVDVLVGMGGGKTIDTAKIVGIAPTFLWLSFLPLLRPTLPAADARSCIRAGCFRIGALREVESAAFW